MQISVFEMQIYVFNLEIKILAFQIQVSAFASGKHAYIILTHLNPSFINTERKKKRRVNFIPKFHSSLKKFVKYFYCDYNTVHVWNKSSKFHWFVINKSRVMN